MEVSRAFPALSCYSKINTVQTKDSINLRVLAVVLGIIQIVVGLSILFSNLQFHATIGWSIFSTGGACVLMAASLKCLRETRPQQTIVIEEPILQKQPIEVKDPQAAPLKQEPKPTDNLLQPPVQAHSPSPLEQVPRRLCESLIFPQLDDRSQHRLSATGKFFKARLEIYWERVCTDEKMWNSRFEIPWSPEMAKKESFSTWKKHYSTIRPIDAASFPLAKLVTKTLFDTKKMWGVSRKIGWGREERIEENTISGNKFIRVYKWDTSSLGLRFKTWDLDTGRSKTWEVEKARQWHIQDSKVALLTPADQNFLTGEVEIPGKLEILDLDTGVITLCMENNNWTWRNARHLRMNTRGQTLICGSAGVYVYDLKKPSQTIKLNSFKPGTRCGWGSQCVVVSSPQNSHVFEVRDPESGELASSYSGSPLSRQRFLHQITHVDQNSLFYWADNHLKGFDLKTCTPLKTEIPIDQNHMGSKLSGGLAFLKSPGGLKIYNAHTNEFLNSASLNKDFKLKGVYMKGRKILLLMSSTYLEDSFQVIQLQAEKK